MGELDIRWQQRLANYDKVLEQLVGVVKQVVSTHSPTSKNRG